jgi:hypothetical protein
MSGVEIMTGVRMPGLTAEKSLGTFIQDYNNLTRTGTESSGIIPTLALGSARMGQESSLMKQGCCSGFCDSPCNAYPCADKDNRCCCEGL